MKFASTIIGLTALAASSHAAPANDGTGAVIEEHKGLVALNGTSESQSSHHNAPAVVLSDKGSTVLTFIQPST
jgi:hypothetical protein